MSAHKFTPGPWMLNKANQCPVIVIELEDGGPALPIVSTVHGYDGFQADANARLIAAAPELLVALKELLTDMVIAQGNMQNAAKRDSMWEGCAQAIQPRVDAARAVIAKATGVAA